MEIKRKFSFIEPGGSNPFVPLKRRRDGEKDMPN